MKKILISLSVILFAAVMLVSCSKNDPKAVAQTWLTSFYQMDYEAAKKVSTDETKTFISQLQALSGMMPDSSKKEMKKVTVTVKDVKEEGDKATVTYTTSAEATKEQKLKMVKKNGVWLVQFSKTDSMGDGAGEPADDKSGTDTSAAPPVSGDAGMSDTTKH